jgi:mRNA interferase RelE/StbE
MFNIIIQPDAEKDLKKLEKNISEIILKKIFSIKETPLHYVEHLTGSPLWKLRIGDYRAILHINFKNKSINVVKVGHRKNIYEKI